MDSWALPVVGLLGVIVGAILNGAVQDRQTEKGLASQERAALRLLSDDLLTVRATMRVAVRDREWWPPSWEFSWSAWDTYRELLAARMEDRDWDQIAAVFFKLRDLVKWLEAQRAGPVPPPPYPGAVPMLEFRVGDDDVRLRNLIQRIEQVRVRIDQLTGANA